MLSARLEPYRLILASHSPRRRRLLADCGLRYVLAPTYEVDEQYPPELPVREVAPFLARLKSDSYPEPLAANDILLTADTVVILNERILGKPRDRADAAAMLRSLSGNTHTVCTGVVLRSATHRRCFAVLTNVGFRALSEEEIDYYLDHFAPYDKAGAYGIQEWIGFAAVERIEGSFYNVMGLPIEQLYVELEKFI